MLALTCQRRSREGQQHHGDEHGCVLREETEEKKERIRQSKQREKVWCFRLCVLVWLEGLLEGEERVCSITLHLRSIELHAR
jgi:hypothetical protein